MKKRKPTWFILAGVIGLLLTAWVVDPETHAENPKVKTVVKKSPGMQLFMRAKLTQAQGILEGLTLEDFGQVEKNAAAMLLLIKAEQWKSSKDPNFLQHSDEFERLTQKLMKYANAKNLDGASLTYMQLTLNCIECHRAVRDKVIALGVLPEDDGGND